MSDDAERRPTATPHEWAGLLRRADIDIEHKGAAFVFASYANTREKNGRGPGEGIYCGVSRFAADIRMSLSTAKRYLAWMRKSGLIELTKKGNARAGLSDEYRLILLTQEQADALGIPDPDVYKEYVGSIARKNREEGAASRKRIRGQLGDPRTETSAKEPSEVTQMTPEVAIRGHEGQLSGVTLDEPPPNMGTTEPMSSTEHEVVDLPGSLTLTRARGREEDSSTNQPSGTDLPAANDQGSPKPTGSWTDDEKIRRAVEFGCCPICYVTQTKVQKAVPGTGYCHIHQPGQDTAA